MGDKSKIEWLNGGATWNPIRARNKATGKIGWFCTHASEGCRNCYAERMNTWRGTGLPYLPKHLGDIELFLDEKMLTQPLRWRRPRMIFTCSMTDLFADFVKDEWIDRIFSVMALAPEHTFQVLTKRAERMHHHLTNHEISREPVHRVLDLAVDVLGKQEFGNRMETRRGWANTTDALPNIWLGVSVEDQKAADERIPWLLKTPAAVRWVSYEPALGPVDLDQYLYNRYHMGGDREMYAKTDWVVAGGESGPDARPMNANWARSVRNQCQSAGVPFFFKQWGAWYPTGIEGVDGPVMIKLGKKASGRILDGRTWDEYPR